MTLGRRTFLRTIAVAGAAAALPDFGQADSAAAVPGSFDFVFFTDTHIEPELEAAHGCDMCFRKIASLAPEFAIMGGDHVYDALAVNSVRATSLFNLYTKAQDTLRLPLYHTIGNHDVFGVVTKSGVAPSDPSYGKKMYEDRMGKTYYSFDRKGYHFIVLDSIQPTDDRLWEARIDEPQLHWLAGDLQQVGPHVPVIVAIHVPLVTGFQFYVQIQNRKYNNVNVSNAPEVISLFEGHNVIAVLQGHAHINELVNYKDTQFITSGAVCGNWWHGPRMDFPEGFTVVSLRNGKISTRYETYGFHSVDIREKF